MNRDFLKICSLFLFTFFGGIAAFAWPNEPLPKGKIIIVFRNDDPSVLSDANQEAKILHIFGKYHIPQVVGVTPVRYHIDKKTEIQTPHFLPENKEMLSLLSENQRKGLIEIAQHGYSHETNQFHPDKLHSSEFSGLSYQGQLEKIIEGRQFLEKWFNIPIKTFIFPWNNYDLISIQAVKAAKISIISNARTDNVPLGSLRGHDVPWIIAETLTLNRFDQDKNYHAALDRFQPAFNSAKNYLKRHPGATLFMDILYHSNTIKTSQDLVDLENILNIIFTDQDALTMAQSDVLRRFPSHIKNLYFEKGEALFEITKVHQVLAYLHLNWLVDPPASFDVLSPTDTYLFLKQKAQFIYGILIFLSISAGCLAAGIYLLLVQRGLINHTWSLALALSGFSLYCVSLFICLKSQVGTLDLMSLIFNGILVGGLVFAFPKGKMKK